MSFISSFLVLILSGYLSFTDRLAESISARLPEREIMIAPDATTPTPAYTELSSEFREIPSILLERAGEQAAVTLESTNTNQYAGEPSDALVNIYCLYRRDNTTRAVTGSGFFIDSDGIILTNAHVAQFLLLEGIYGETDCIIRTGNPAVPTYEVALLYISPSWIMKHAALIEEARPRGTGERDYAYLYVTNGLDNKPVPRSFPALKMNTTPLTAADRGLRVSVLGYPAETAFAASDAAAPLIPKKAVSRVTELMTFGNNHADVVSLAGTSVGEQGSSGGPLLDGEGQVIGLISTRGDDTRFGTGSLRAITLSYIARTYEEETGVSFTRGLTGDLPYRARLFRETMVPILQLMLEQEL